MKIVITSFFCLLIGLLSAQNVDVNKISPLLLGEMQQRSGHLIPTLILLEDQLDIDRMVDSFEVNNISIHNRAVTVNKRLRAIAAAQQPEIRQQLENMGIEKVEGLWVINSLYVHADVDQIYQMSGIEGVQYLDLDLPAELDEPSLRILDAGSRSSAPGEIEPGIEVIKAPEMWKRGYTGYGTRALIIDTGVDPTHPTLSRNYLGNTRPESQAWFQDANVSRPGDCDNHGTHVAGTILGIDRETLDTIGVAYNAMWMGAAGLCGGANFVLFRSFEWALDPDNNPETTDDMPDVINNSWRSGLGGDECNSSFAQIFTVLETAGVAVVFSAGNSGPDSFTITSPKNVNRNLVNTFTVAAVDGRNLNAAGFSSRGPSLCGGVGSLLIKPEVSAPGVNVRSAIRNGGFGSFSGTSMAAPHVSGAILLLKEAFPYLSGDQLKLALYFTAIDLGDEGEDDVYGMGLIDVDAAFEYLVEAGNEPVSPFKNVDLAIEQFTYDLDYCSGEITLFLVLKNNGQETISSVKVDVLDNSNNQEEIFTVMVNEEIPLESSRIVTIPLQFAGRDQIDLSIIADLEDQTDERTINNIVSINLDITQTADWQLSLNQEAFSKFLCSDTRIILSNESTEGTYKWYNGATNNDPFHIGNEYIFAAPNNDTVVDIFLGLEVNETILNPTFDNPSFALTPELASGIIFQTLQDVRLDHLTLNNTVRTFHSLKIADDQENFIWGINRFFNAGEVIVPVGVTIPKGSTVILSTTANRDVLMTDFPNMTSENMEGYVRILGSLLNEEYTTDLLPGMYGLSFSAEAPCARKPLRLHVKKLDNPPSSFFEISPEIELTAGQMVQFTNQSTYAEQYEWDFGNGVTSTEFSPGLIYSDPGDYHITLKARAGSCLDVYKTTITINESSVSTKEITSSNAIQIFPNPTRGYFTVSPDANSGDIRELLLISVTGVQYPLQPGLSSNGQFRFHLNNQNIPGGIYIVKTIMADDRVYINRLMIY